MDKPPEIKRNEETKCGTEVGLNVAKKKQGQNMSRENKLFNN